MTLSLKRRPVNFKEIPSTANPQTIKRRSLWENGAGRKKRRKRTGSIYGKSFGRVYSFGVTGDSSPSMHKISTAGT